MNNRLLFRWGHILACVGLIALAYMLFAGMSFQSGGNFRLAGLWTAVIVVLTFVFFFFAQQLKGWDLVFRKYIWVERAFVIVFGPLMLVWAARPVANYIGILQHQEMLTGQFACAVDTSKAMFADYEAYANARLEAYDHQIGRLYLQRSARRGRPAASPLERENRLRALRLQLLSPDYEAMRQNALKWVDGAKESSTTTLYVFLNVFVMGNIDEIESAIDGWNTQLAELSARRLSDEPDGVGPFSGETSSTVAAKQLLDDLKLQYRQQQPVLTVSVVATMLVLWVLLMVPYFIQNRHTRSTFRLFGSEHRGGFTLKESDDEPENLMFTLNKTK